MQPIYQQEFTINDAAVDCFGRLKPSMLLFYVQEVAGIHATSLGAGYDALALKTVNGGGLRGDLSYHFDERYDTALAAISADRSWE